ncbi:MAG: hypothetical protein QOF51_1284, partial [Chloroflexota bacterium]|nr:hypothetical protein [Chloroflexota bacterium]
MHGPSFPRLRQSIVVSCLGALAGLLCTIVLGLTQPLVIAAQPSRPVLALYYPWYNL